MCLVLGRIRNFPQKNGADIQLRVYGDEFYARYETLDGYTVVYDTDKDLYCFSVLAGGRLVSSGAPTHKPVPLGVVRHLQEDKGIRNSRFDERFRLMRPKKSPPPGVSATLGRNNGLLPGTRLNREARVKGLTILVEFKDVRTRITRDHVDGLLNGENFTAYGNACSVREYYKTMSSSRIEYVNEVVGPVRLSRNRTHYIANPCMKEALDLAVSEFGVDLSLFDCKQRGVVDAVNFLYAGETLYEDWLWPHNYSMDYSRNGMRTDLYTIQSLGRSPVDMKIGTFCHEAGHLICRFPDLYDYGSRDGDSDPSAGLGYYCLMSSGSHLNRGRNPSPLCGYLRHLAGWAENEVLLNHPGNFRAVHGDYNTIHKYVVDDRPNEYFIVENRTRMNLDRYAMSSGLAVYHCDILGSNEWQGGTADRHYQCALVQADGARNLENNRNQGDDADLFREKPGLALSRDTIPSSRAWGGLESGLKLYDVGPPGDAISFSTGSPAEPEGSGETIVKESRPSLLIPDNDPEGVWDEIEFFKSGLIEKIKLSLDITHTYIQDLKIMLEPPQGPALTLVEKEGGSRDDIRAEFDSDSKLAPLKGTPFAGIWKLWVADTAGQDIGRLNWWKMELDYSDRETRIQEEKTENRPIPDIDRAGIGSVIPLDRPGTLSDIKVWFEIDHSYHGDLSVILGSPSGSRAVLIPFNSLGSKKGILAGEFTSASLPALADLLHEQIQGEWTLHVSDGWERDTGVLKKWGLEMSAEN
ncbi:M6 family metalloprotease domain-containing protein [Desulfospira joergensenii]|uniref:M6 family metalloprotease domain-containing protein n=1 Tax=Desulfospira joergensenii TaxID=53329 RepID=UPI0003B32F86|nr:M6 family metalloprotease domain-containing protein [Desulfospira joergensenii]